MDNAKVYNLLPTFERNVTDYIKKHNLTNEDFAQEIGCSRSTVSQIVNGNYTSKASDTRDKIIEYLREKGEYSDVSKLELLFNSRSDFFSTEDTKNILGICKSCQELQALGVIVGNSGYGKTFALKQYAKRPNICYIECDDSMSCRDLIEAIERQIGIPSSYGSMWKRVNEIRDYFNSNKGYLLIIDEADKLITKYAQKKMEILRGIYDQSDVGLIVAGEPNLESKLRGYLARFANRVDFYDNLKGLSKDEVRGFLRDYNFTEEAMKEMIKRATNSQNGCFRLLDRTLKNILRLASSGEEIDIEFIRRTSKMMML